MWLRCAVPPLLASFIERLRRCPNLITVPLDCFYIDCLQLNWPKTAVARFIT